jgi:hypothetical protein
MKINEIIQEGVWDQLKTTGQQIRQGAGTVANKVGQGARSAYNTVVQPQARQQRFAQAAASQNLTPAQLRTQNVGTFVGDVARTIGQSQGGVSGGSMMAKATPTIPKKTIPVGTKLEIPQLGTFNMTAQGWYHADTNQPVKDPNIVNKLNANYLNTADNSLDGSVDKSPPPSAGKPPGPGYVWNGTLWVPAK